MSGLAAAVEVPTVHGAPLRPGDAVRLDAHAHAWIDPPAGLRALGATDAQLDALLGGNLLHRAARPPVPPHAHDPRPPRSRP